jgi:outer membrane protein
VALPRYFRALALGSVVFASVAGAQSAQAESLADALRSAYAENPTLDAERARQRGTDELVPAAKSGWRPTIVARATGQRQWQDEKARLFEDVAANPGIPPVIPAQPARVDRTVTDSRTDTTDVGISIQLSQPIFRGFQTVEGIASAESTVKAGRQQLLSVEQSVLYNAVLAYLSVVKDRQILAIRQQNVKNLQKQANGAQSRFEVGEVTKTDVAQARARVSNAQGEVAVAKSNLESSAAAYEAIIGHRPGQKMSYAKLGQIPKSLTAALSKANEVNPSILAAAWVFDASQHDVKVAFGRLLPEVSFSASASTNFTNQRLDSESVGANENERGQRNKTRSNAASVALTMTVPIYQGGSEYAAVRQAKETANQRSIQIIQATRSVRQQVSAAWNLLVSSKQSIIAAKAQVSAANLALDGIEQEYLVGSRTTIDVLNAQQELLNARVGLINAEYAQVLANYQLQQAIGKLTYKHLGLGEGYNPNLHYNAVKDKWIGTGTP